MNGQDNFNPYFICNSIHTIQDIDVFLNTLSDVQYVQLLNKWNDLKMIQYLRNRSKHNLIKSTSFDVMFNQNSDELEEE